MEKVYLYPKVFPAENPYIINLENSLSYFYNIVNKETSRSGVLDLFKYFLQADIYYFNWIENLPSRRFGKIQIILFTFFLLLARVFKKKIIWTLHNKYSHDQDPNRWVDYMYQVMFKNAGFILTHSKAGIEFAEEKYPAAAKKLRYFIHPVKNIFKNTFVKDPEYDLMIWGTIWLYKGVIEFLDFLKESGQTHIKVLIVGRCIDENMAILLKQHLTTNTVHLDHFYELEEIAGFSNQARFILFTYKPESVLSSGSLMDSIGMGSVIVGPDTGAFKDLSSLSFIKTYNSFSDIIAIINNLEQSDIVDSSDTEQFCRDNTWELFGERLSKELFKANI